MKFIASLFLLVLLVGCTANHYPVPAIDTNTVIVRVDGKKAMQFENVVTIIEEGSSMKVIQMIDGKTQARAIFYGLDDTEWDWVETPIKSRVSNKPPRKTLPAKPSPEPREGDSMEPTTDGREIK